jgi:hypothetical protein
MFEFQHVEEGTSFLAKMLTVFLYYQNKHEKATRQRRFSGLFSYILPGTSGIYQLYLQQVRFFDPAHILK